MHLMKLVSWCGKWNGICIQLKYKKMLPTILVAVHWVLRKSFMQSGIYERGYVFYWIITNQKFNSFIFECYHSQIFNTTYSYFMVLRELNHWQIVSFRNEDEFAIVCIERHENATNSPQYNCACTIWVWDGV